MNSILSILFLGKIKLKCSKCLIFL